MDAMIDRSLLDAFVDGALSPEESARVVMHMANSPEASAYVDAVMEANELLSVAYAAPMYEPLPERFRAAIFAGTTPAARPAGAGWRPLARRMPVMLGGALAASLGLAVGLTALPAWRAGTGALTAAAGPDDLLTLALETSPSGSVEFAPESLELTLIGTFFDSDGRACREFESVDRAAGMQTQGVACRAGRAAWVTEVAVATRIEAASVEVNYVPAEGAASQALDETFDRLGAGMSLGPDEERRLITDGWAG